MNRLTRGRGRHPNIFQFHLSIRPIGLLIGKPKSWIAAHVSTYYRTSTEEEADVMHARPGHVIQSSFRYNGFVMLDYANHWYVGCAVILRKNIEEMKNFA